MDNRGTQSEATEGPKKRHFDIKYSDRKSGTSWNEWGFYHVELMPVVDGYCQQTVPGTERLVVTYDNLPLARIPIQKGAFLPHSDEIVKWYDAQAVCCIRDDDGVTAAQETLIRWMADLIMGNIVEREFTGLIRQNTRLGRRLIELGCTEAIER